MTHPKDIGASIARIWRGRVARHRADEYQTYLMATGIEPLQKTALAVEALREDRDTETEFIVISYWESVEAMQRFAGAEARRIHHLPKDEQYLLELPKAVQVLNILPLPALAGAGDDGTG